MRTTFRLLWSVLVFASAAHARVPAATSSTRAVGDRSTDEVNVTDFGAAPDDRLDDTVAIQQALDAHRPVFFPPGVYLISKSLTVSGGFHIRGPGAILSSSQSSGSLLVASGDLAGFSMRDITLKSTRNDLSARGGALLQIDYSNVDGGLIDNVSFDTGPSYSNGILLAAQLNKTVKNITIRGCRFTGASAGVEVVQHADATQRISGVSILNNVLRHNGLKDDQVAGFGISLSGPHNGISVIGNDIRDYPYAGIEIAGRVGFTADYSFQANKLINCGRGLIIDAPHNQRISRVSIVGNSVVTPRFFQRFEHLADSEIAGNHIEAISARPSSDRQNEFVSFRHSDRVTVTGNNITLDLPDSEGNKSVVTFIGFNSGTFSSNQVRTTGLAVLRFDATSATTADNVIVGNRIVHDRAGSHTGTIAFTGVGATRNSLGENVIYSKTSLCYVSSRGATGNVATGTKRYRTDLGRFSTSDYVVQAVTGATDLSNAVELRNIRLEGSPAGGFTLTLPSRDAFYTISNHTGQPATVTAASGRVTVMSGAVMHVIVAGGVTTSF